LQKGSTGRFYNSLVLQEKIDQIRGKLLKGGFGEGPGKLQEPSDLGGVGGGC